jgi:glutathione S-transferase
MNTNEMVVNLLQVHCGSSSFICRYPEDLEKRACVDRVLDWHFGNLRRGVSPFVVHRELAPLLGRTKNPTLAAEAEACLKQSLKTMETVWLKDSPFLDGRSQPSIADISCACELQQLKLLDKEESGALLAPYEKVKAWMVAVEEFTGPYFVEVHGGLEKLAKVLEDRRKSEAEAELE